MVESKESTRRRRGGEEKKSKATLCQLSSLSSSPSSSLPSIIYIAVAAQRGEKVSQRSTQEYIQRSMCTTLLYMQRSCDILIER